MGLLLHFSDLHLGKNIEEEEKRIHELAKTINDEKLKIENVIFTGDIVDANVITVSTLKRLKNDSILEKFEEFLKELNAVFELIEEKGTWNDKEVLKKVGEVLKQFEDADDEIVEKYNNYLKEVAAKCVKDAADIINNFLKSINVKNDKFVSCCGNHDKLRFLGKVNTFDCDADKKVDELSFKEEYSPYNEFCNYVNKNLNYRSQKYECDGICYVIANTNWRTPKNKETNNACISCYDLSLILDEIENKEDYKKTTTIFLSHKPFDDICENFKFIYKGNNNRTTVKEHIKRTTILSLHGDKHSYTVDIHNSHSELMCGLPICEDGVHYYLIDFSKDKGVGSVKFLVYNKNRWSLVPMAECVKEGYLLCKKHIKNFAIQLISKKRERPTNWEKLFKVVDESFSNGRFDLIRTLFRESTTIYDSKQVKIPYKDDLIFEDIFNLVNSSSEHRVLCVKGEPGTGKSTFLSILYIYFLRKFYDGDTKYIPFYFDLDSLTKNRDSSFVDVSEIINWYSKEFKEFLNRVLELSSKYGLPPFIIVDGLDTNNMLTYSCHTVEHYFYRIIEETIKLNDGKYVMGLNTNRNSRAEKSFVQVNKFEYACFLNKVFIVPYKNKERHTKYIRAYLKLIKDATESEIKQFYDILMKLRRISVDLDYIHGLDELLKDDIAEDDSWKLMKRKLELTTKRVEQAFGETNEEVLYRAAFLLFFQNNTYQLILENVAMKELTYEDFLKIRDNPEITKYLIARHYIEELRKYANSNEKIEEESILNFFISRDIAVTIRLQLEDLGLQAQVFKNIVEKHDELHGYFRSFLFYLLGHNKIYKGLSAVKTEKLTKQDDNIFLNECIYRSYKLAQIVSMDDKEQRQESNNLLLRLMTDEKFRLFNRIYQLWYYEDIGDPAVGKNGYPELSTKIKKGFDFHNCFMFLVSKIDYCFAHNEPYPLLEVDMFTLCDFIYSRLQNFDSQSMFYSASYNKKHNSVSASVLKRIVDIINKYFGRYVHSEQERNLKSHILDYFESVRELFDKISIELEKNAGNDIGKPFVSPGADFGKVIDLCEMPRIGWNIRKKTDVIYKKDIPQYDNVGNDKKHKQEDKCVIFETIGQHILESVYIAEMFLPEEIQEKDYAKSKVLSMILMSEVGKIAIGHDYTPDFYQANRYYMPRERIGRKQFLIQGAFDGYANLMNLYDAMQGDGGSLSIYSDINERICQEIKLIQMEYKFYSLKEQLEFDNERDADFRSEFVDLITPVCKKIRRLLVTENVAFRKYFEK